MYALNDRTGAVIWTYHAAGSVKASPSLSGGVLYFGDYSGQVQAISEAERPAGCGEAAPRAPCWEAAPSTPPPRSSTGACSSATPTGACTPTTPTPEGSTGPSRRAPTCTPLRRVTNAPGLGPTVYFGSYDGKFYALNARTGAIDWRFAAGGKISGSATIIGRTVYLADLGQRRIYGLGISTGHKIFEMDTGAFDPAVSDGHDVYLTGYSGLFGHGTAGGRGIEPQGGRHARDEDAREAKPGAPRSARGRARRER